MNRDESVHLGPARGREILQDVLADQVRQVYSLSIYGTVATVINGFIVFFVLRSVIPPAVLTSWLAALLTVTAFRAALVVRYRHAGPPRPEARIWKNRFIAELWITGMVWGSLALLPFSGSSIIHEVFLAFVLGGMAAGAAVTFSELKQGYLAYAIPAVTPLAIRFLLAGDMVHSAMAGMLAFYGFLLWRISGRHYQANRTSLVLSFENREMIDSLKRARGGLLTEIDAKLRAEAELREHQEHLERTIRERTSDLIFANESMKRQIAERKQAEERLALAQRAGGVGVFDLDMISGRVVWTAQMEKLFGLEAGAFEGGYQDWARRVHPDDLPLIEGKIRSSLQEGLKQIELEYRCIRADGQVRWMAATAQVVYSVDGRPLRMIGTDVDITERKKLEEEIIHLAHHDFLTGLPNRLLFRNMVHLEIAQARRTGHMLALFFLDLDRFKEVNDTFGHNAGDELLKQVSKRIKGAIRESDTVARIGGDEFNIMLTDISRTEDVTIVGRKILHALNMPFRVAGYELLATASIGISIYPSDSTETETLYRYADIAMYHAKMLGRNNFQFYNAEINIRSVECIRLENMLRQSIERGELEVFYQPLVDTQTRRMVCAEALARWRHPEKGLIEAKQFIPTAEETGFITAIDEHVLRTACEQSRSWQLAGLPPVCITVNLSAREFDDPDLVLKIKRTLEETGALPECLNVEITESLAMRNIQRTVNRLNELAVIGVHASIDDFGTGYSSLNYLKRLSIQKLKIDQSFIHDIATDDDDKAIISAVTAMAHNMKMKVIAEGVETEDQLSFVRRAGCDEAQGHLFNRALPAEEFGRLLTGS